jgi:hypothetical protein
MARQGPCREHSVGHIAGDDASRANDRARADPHAGEEQRAAERQAQRDWRG